MDFSFIFLMFLYIYFNILTSLINHRANLLFFGFLNEFGFFTKFLKNSVIFIRSNTIILEANYAISKIDTLLFYTLLTYFYKYYFKLCFLFLVCPSIVR